MDNDKTQNKLQSGKKTEKDHSEMHWESYNPIRMNRRNVNQNIGEKKSFLHKLFKGSFIKPLCFFLAGIVAIAVFVFVCINIGNQFKKDRSEETATSAGETTKRVENVTIADTQEETVIAEFVFPEKEIKDLDIIGGSGEIIGFSFPDQSSKKWILLKKYFEDTMTNAGYNTEFRYAEMTQADESDSGDAVSQQISDIRELADEGAKIIFVAPVDVTSSELGSLLTEVKNSGIYIIALDHLPMNTSGVNYLFGYDDYHVGEAMGKYIVDKLELDKATTEAPRTVEIFTGDITDDTLLFLYPGLMETLFPYIDSGVLLAGSGQLELEQVSIMDGSEQAAYERMNTMMDQVYRTRNLDAVICTDDVIAGGVSKAIVEAVLRGTYGGRMPVITGDGCDDDALDRILQGTQSMSILHEPKEYSYRGTELTDAIIHGGAVDVIDSEMYQNGKLVVPACELKPVVVNADNYEDLIVKRGYLQTSVLLD
ncbi:substrate-binding domain-containing protein [Oribacterium sp. P6A1]|uniref:substrate-binding domain-containing protein n=1 Tax=Oribacterium sp. P6A1 TaxID=1410612 RepID=UPI0005673094|nr:sugar-binding protein [Oribacterium sp. P6A1]